MFKQPTIRARRNPNGKPKRYTFLDAPMPLSGAKRPWPPNDNDEASAQSWVGTHKTGYRVNDDDPSLPATASGKPDGKPSSTTLGGTAGPGMYQELVAAFPIEGDRWAYWPNASLEGYRIMRQELGTGFPPVQVGMFPNQPNSYYWFDQNTTIFRLWRTYRQPIDMDNRPGIAAGLAASKAVGDSARRIQQINQMNKKAWNNRS
jgi:hypothetical protein